MSALVCAGHWVSPSPSTRNSHLLPKSPRITSEPVISITLGIHVTTCPLHNCVLKHRICVTYGFSSISSWVILHTRQAKFPYTHTQSFQSHYHHWNQPKDTLKEDSQVASVRCLRGTTDRCSEAAGTRTLVQTPAPAVPLPSVRLPGRWAGVQRVLRSIKWGLLTCLPNHLSPSQCQMVTIIPPLPHAQAFLSQAAFLFKQVPIPSETYIWSPRTCKLRHEDQEFEVHMGYMVRWNWATQ